MQRTKLVVGTEYAYYPYPRSSWKGTPRKAVLLDKDTVVGRTHGYSRKSVIGAKIMLDSYNPEITPAFETLTKFENLVETWAEYEKREAEDKALRDAQRAEREAARIERERQNAEMAAQRAAVKAALQDELESLTGLRENLDVTSLSIALRYVKAALTDPILRNAADPDEFVSRGC